MSNVVLVIALLATSLVLITSTLARFWLCMERAVCLQTKDDSEDTFSQEDHDHGR